MSSIKTRKHYVIFDMAFSGVWAFFYFISFTYMCIAWSKTEDTKFSFASSNIIGAIFFAFLSVFAWVSSAAGKKPVKTVKCLMTSKEVGLLGKKDKWLEEKLYPICIYVCVVIYSIHVIRFIT